MRGSFIVEAKSGGTSISKLEVEQAHSYAAHAEVGANYFVLVNGSEIQIFATLSGPSASPVVSIPLFDVNLRFHEMENILAPSQLAKNCKVVYDTRLKLCEGLGSSVGIRNGEYKIGELAYHIFVDGQDRTAVLRTTWPQLVELDRQLDLFRTTFDLKISQGIIERDGDGRVTAQTEFSGVTRFNSEGMKLIGIDKATFVTGDKFLSGEENAPSMFEATKDFAVEKGASMPQMFGGLVTLEHDFTGKMSIRAAMYVCDDVVRGTYLASGYYRIQPLLGPLVEIEADFAGEFDLSLDV